MRCGDAGWLGASCVLVCAMRKSGSATWSGSRPSERHWNGATAATAMTQNAIAEALDGEVVDWMEKVTRSSNMPLDSGQARQSPDLPPVLASRRTPPIVMPLSIALAMS